MAVSGRRSRRKRVADGSKFAPKATDWDNEPLGEIPDPQLAKMLGVTTNAVWRARKSRGIPSAHPSRLKGIDWSSEPLGEVPDALLAWIKNVIPNVVGAMPLARNIAPPPGLRCPHCDAEVSLRDERGALVLGRRRDGGPQARKR